MNKLFVYGIFLGEGMRQSYNMTDPHYDTVSDFVTMGDYIVQAVPVDKGSGLQLTGLVVTVADEEWDGIDELERGYERIRVTTNRGVQAYMYAAKGTTKARKEEKYEQA